MSKFASQFNDSTAFLQPARQYFVVTPSDTVDMPFLSRELIVTNSTLATPTSMTVVREDGTEVAFNHLPSGTRLPIVAKRIKATGLTAGAHIVALS